MFVVINYTPVQILYPNTVFEASQLLKIFYIETAKILPSTDLILICQRENGNFSIEGRLAYIENVEIFVVKRFMTSFLYVILKIFF